MAALTSNSLPAKLLRPARLCSQKCHHWLGKKFGADGRPEIVKLRDEIQALLSGFRQAEKLAKKRLGSLVRSDPPLDLSLETGVTPLFYTSGPGIFQKRTQSRKHKSEKEIGPKWLHCRAGF
jgi:hypothetical protein